MVMDMPISMDENRGGGIGEDNLHHPPPPEFKDIYVTRICWELL